MTHNHIYEVPFGFDPAMLHPFERGNDPKFFRIPYLAGSGGEGKLHTFEIGLDQILISASDNLGNVVLMGVTDRDLLVTLSKKETSYAVRSQQLSRSEAAEIKAIGKEALGLASMDANQTAPTQEENIVALLPQSQVSAEEECDAA